MHKCVCFIFIYGPVPSKDMQTPPPLLRSGHLCIKDAQSAETDEKLCIRFFRFLVFELLESKKVQKDAQKIKINSEVAKFTGKIRIDQTMILNIHNFFLCDSQFLRYSQFSNVCVHFFVFQLIFVSYFLSQKMRNVLIRVFVSMIFFCAILSL